MTSRVHIGVSPLLWNNDDDPALGTDASLEHVLSQTAATGYAGIELGHKFPRAPAQLHDILDRHGLSLISGWYSARLLERGLDAELEAMDGHARLLAEMGCNLMVYADVSGAVHRRPMSLRRRPRIEEGSWPTFCVELDRVAAALGERGIRLAYHPHMGTVVQTADEVERLMADTKLAGLALDTGHFAYAGGKPAQLAELIRRHADRVVHVHLKDVVGDVLAGALRNDSPFLHAVGAGVFTVPGEGTFDFAPALAALAAADFGGWLVVEAEQDGKRIPPDELAALGLANVRALATAAGL